MPSRNEIYQNLCFSSWRFIDLNNNCHHRYNTELQQFYVKNTLCKQLRKYKITHKMVYSTEVKLTKQEYALIPYPPNACAQHPCTLIQSRSTNTHQTHTQPHIHSYHAPHTFTQSHTPPPLNFFTNNHCLCQRLGFVLFTDKAASAKHELSAKGSRNERFSATKICRR